MNIHSDSLSLFEQAIGEIRHFGPDAMTPFVAAVYIAYRGTESTPKWP